MVFFSKTISNFVFFSLSRTQLSFKCVQPESHCLLLFGIHSATCLIIFFTFFDNRKSNIEHCFSQVALHSCACAATFFAIFALALAPQLFSLSCACACAATFFTQLRLRLRRNFFSQKSAVRRNLKTKFSASATLDILMKSGSKQMTNEIIFKR